MTMTQDRRSLRTSPFKYESERRLAEKMQEDGNMPKDLPGLVRWYERKTWEKIPTDLHNRGLAPDGGPVYADEFRRILENSPSEVDYRDTGTDGRAPYNRPIDAALQRMGYHHPLTARILKRLQGNFDWVTLGSDMRFPNEVWHMYLKEALVMLWREYRDFTRAS